MADTGTFRSAINAGVTKMVSLACDGAAAKLGEAARMTENDRNAVMGLLCDSINLVAETVVKREASPTDVGIYLIQNLINAAKLTQNQQVLCNAARVEFLARSFELGAAATATFAATVPSAGAGIVAGGIYGSVYPVVGTTLGAAVGGVAGAAGPLLIGSAAMYEKAAKLADAAFSVHSQCGPLAFDKVTPARSPDAAGLAAGLATAWCGPDQASEATSSTA